VALMAGWNLKNGLITDFKPNEQKIWSLFNFVFSDSSPKRNSYKFGLIKSLLDNAFNVQECNEGCFLTYTQIFSRFAENYWNLVVKYNLRQMRADGKSSISKIEQIFQDAIKEESVLTTLEFDSLDEKTRSEIIKKVTKECKQYVVGALYSDFDGVIYSFDLKEKGIILNKVICDFMLKYKSELERLNYYSWAKFLEKVNSDNALVRLLDKLDSATPKRNDLSIYREILRKEFEENTCFYCGKKLGNNIHVDHFIPWSFVKDDKLWNFVLACPTCNTKKNNKLPTFESLEKIQIRNKLIMHSRQLIVQNDFEFYSEDLLEKMWYYAKLSGLKEL
jgi:hypothetical protein